MIDNTRDHKSRGAETWNSIMELQHRDSHNHTFIPNRKHVYFTTHYNCPSWANHSCFNTMHYDTSLPSRHFRSHRVHHSESSASAARWTRCLTHGVLTLWAPRFTAYQPHTILLAARHGDNARAFTFWFLYGWPASFLPSSGTD